MHATVLAVGGEVARVGAELDGVGRPGVEALAPLADGALTLSPARRASVLNAACKAFASGSGGALTARDADTIMGSALQLAREGQDHALGAPVFHVLRLRWHVQHLTERTPSEDAERWPDSCCTLRS